MLTSASDHYARQQRINALGLTNARRARRRRSLPKLVGVVTLFQGIAARDAAESVPLMLEEQGIDPKPVARPVPTAIAGTANDGRSLESLMAFASLPTFRPQSFDRLVTTLFQDAARQSASVGMAVRPQVTRYVRMLTPPSCARCVQLAGVEYKSEVAFQRHPGCDCRHIPSSEALAGDITTDPSAYFDDLPTAEDLAESYPDMTVAQRRKAGLVSQEDTFTVAGARAIRDGADVQQVVNARAGMSTAQVANRGAGDRWTASGRAVRQDVYGQKLFTTTEGMTKRGVAHEARAGKQVRLMPESLYEIADSQEDAIRLLKAHGYVR